LNQQAADKEALKNASAEEIEAMENKYEGLQGEYDQKLADIEDLEGQREAERGRLEKQLADQAAEKAALEKAAADQLAGLDRKYQDLQGDFEEKLGELASLQDEIAAGREEMQGLKDDYEGQLQDLGDRYEDLQGTYQDKLGELASLQDEIAAGKEEMQGLKDDYEGRLKDLGDQYQALKDDYEGNAGKIAALESDLAEAQAKLADAAEDLGKAESDLAATSEELQKVLELARDRQDVAQRIKEGFEQAGIKADVDSGTGDVILDFGEEYFDTDSAELKPGMREITRDAMPVYADSLFGRDIGSGKISAVEIIGFASPTFGGKPVNPRSLDTANRRAVNYNLDLSYERARSIFKYAFNPRTLKFEHQETMLPLIKVTGRSFFTEEVNPDDTGNLSREEFCKLYDCFGSQRVIIKFDLKEKENS
jgi:predicted  nucleic acid-binding Zn-ribbon protein